jgi:large-conductance mechanosensitive channel
MRELINLAVVVLIAIVFGNIAFALVNHFLIK